MIDVSTTAPLPAECLVSVTVQASCAIPNCAWRYEKVSTYDRMPSVKAAYFTHVKVDHPGYLVSARNQRSELIPPSMVELARVQLAAVLG